MTPGTPALQRVLERLDAVHSTSSGYMARCPAHNDRIPSLSIGISRRGRGVLLHCFAGCGTEDVLAALGLTYGDLLDNAFGIPLVREPVGYSIDRPISVTTTPATKRPRLGRPSAIYTYQDELGDMVMQVRRWETSTGKVIRQRRPDGSGGWIHNLTGVRRVLYHLPELIEAIARGEKIYLVEGEKNVEDLRRNGLAATTNPHGAGTWNTYGDGYGRSLAGADVILLADNDAPGFAHRSEVAASIEPFVRSLRLVDLPGLEREGDDVSDWLAGGGSIAELEQLATRRAGKSRARRE